MTELSINKGIKKKLMASRYMFNMAKKELSYHSDISLLATINSLQDSIEYFLLAIADHLCVSIRENESFSEYIKKINEKLIEQRYNLRELPLSNQLNRINKTRVESKHRAIIPNRNECTQMLMDAGAFLRNVCEKIFNVNYETNHFIDLLKDGESKDFLRKAEIALINDDYFEVLINCRKAIYTEIEKEYDIRSYHTNKLISYTCKAPDFAKTEDYLNIVVREPTDYIVHDKVNLMMDLSKYKINLFDFYEIIKITPNLYKYNDNWIIKEEFNLIELAKENASYVFDKTLDIILLIHEHKKSERLTYSHNFQVNLKKRSIPVYEKSDKKSTIVATIPSEMRKISCSHRTSDLDGKIFIYISGYISNEFVIGYISKEDTED